jgi:hypothetical protein
VNERLRGFLMHPMGWMLAQLLGLVIVAAIAIGAIHLFPGMSQGARLLVIFGAASALAALMYWIRRRYLQPDE